MSTGFDLIVRGGTVIDGTGAPRRHADVGIAGGRVARIGDLSTARARDTIDAAGRVVAPGFIDAHTHDDRLLLSDRAVRPKVAQGVTTVITGNCGISLACSPACGAGAAPVPPLDLLDDQGGWFRFPAFADYRAALADSPPAVNAACLVGHTSLRVATMDRLDRPATAEQVGAMRTIVAAALREGALGVSTGTAYAPAAAAPTEELVEVCRPLTTLGGIYATHMRNEDDAIDAALEETFAIGRTLGVPVVVSHHKCVGEANHGRSTDTLRRIRAAGAAQPVGLDCYPYVASSTVLRADRLAQSSRVLLTWSRPHPEFAGLELGEIARRLGTTEAQAVERLKPGGAVYFMLAEEDVRRILADEATMIGSDGLPHDARPHPRLWGTFPRVLGHYARELGLFPLEIAVRKMTGLTAERFGLADRGVLRPGAWADITVFDADTVRDAADFAEPSRPPVGIDAVVVNGRVVLRDGCDTGERPGRLLPGPGSRR